MAVYPQYLMDLNDEIIVDLFAGGGGASTGIEMATGRQVDVAINHDAAAVALHRANHPQTTHHVCDVFEADPHAVTNGRPVGLLWASPDCTDHSKAKGGKPIRTRKRRALAWVVKRWAGQVRPRVICLENVEEFVDWGPLVGPPGRLRRDDKRKGRTFRRFVRQLEGLGYQVEWRELRACDYGAPTIRKRLFLVARCDGHPIVWPEATHGPGARRPYRTAAECIDWSIPMLSIFAEPDEAKAWAKAQRAAGWQMGTPKRPLAEATLRRIARGVVRFVLEAKKPFLVSLAHGYSGGRREYPLSDPVGTQHSGGNKYAVVAPIIAGVGGRQSQSPERSVGAPYQTITTKADSVVVAPYLVPRYGERKGQEPRTRSIRRPHPVVVPTGNGAQLVSAFLAKHYGGVVGTPLDEPGGTVTTIDHHGLVAASLTKLRGTSSDADPAGPLHTVSAGGTHHGLVAAHLTKFQQNGAGADARHPMHTVMAGASRHAAVAAFLQKYYGTGVSQGVGDPAPTLTTKDRMGLVTVQVEGQPYVVVDIAMRMLQPRELYRAQGFPDAYVIEHGADGRRMTKTEQVRMVGNSVSPQVAAALVRANAPELRVRDEAAA